jgi:hypothetical protein
MSSPRLVIHIGTDTASPNLTSSLRFMRSAIWLILWLGLQPLFLFLGCLRWNLELIFTFLFHLFFHTFQPSSYLFLISKALPLFSECRLSSFTWLFLFTESKWMTLLLVHLAPHSYYCLFLMSLLQFVLLSF